MGRTSRSARVLLDPPSVAAIKRVAKPARPAGRPAADQEVRPTIKLLVAKLRRGHGVGCVIGAADQRTALHVPESHLVTQALELGEFFHAHVAHDGQVLERGPQILAQRQNVDVGLRAGRASREALLRWFRPSPSIRPLFVGISGRDVFTYASMSSERS